jgi:hypothetical protein
VFSIINKMTLTMIIYNIQINFLPGDVPGTEHLQTSLQVDAKYICLSGSRNGTQIKAR